VQQKYSFVPRERFPRLEDIDVAAVAGDLYGRIMLTGGVKQEQQEGILECVVEDPEIDFESGWIDEVKDPIPDVREDVESESDVGVEGSPNAAHESEDNQIQIDVEAEKEITHESRDNQIQIYLEDEKERTEMEEKEKNSKKKKKSKKKSKNKYQLSKRVDSSMKTFFEKGLNQYQLPHKYQTRSKGVVLAVNARPPKPSIPKKSEAMKLPEWKRAMERELEKINAEDTILELPKDLDGDYILPEDPIVMRMFEILDYKWKVDPDTGEERWLEVIRAVVDGSTDERKEGVYAETPDRSVLLMMMSMGASIGEKSITSDAVRAYLNAEALDPNLVVIASPHMRSIPKMGILNKGLYGTLKGARGWEVWIEKKLAEINFTNSSKRIYSGR
jgi:hypothetical protein